MSLHIHLTSKCIFIHEPILVPQKTNFEDKSLVAFSFLFSIYILFIISVYVGLVPHWLNLILSLEVCSVYGASDWPVNGCKAGANRH